MEITYTKELMFEEQTRFIALVNSITPFFSSQLALLKEVANLERDIQSFQHEFKNQEILNSHAQNLLAQYALNSMKESGSSLLNSSTLGDDLISLSSSCSFSRRSILSSISDNVDIKNFGLENDEGYIGSNPGDLTNLTLGRVEESSSNDENKPIITRHSKDDELSTSTTTATTSESESGSDDSSDDENEEGSEEVQCTDTHKNENNSDRHLRTGQALQTIVMSKLDDEIIPAVGSIKLKNNNLPRHFTISGAYSRAHNQTQHRRPLLQHQQAYDGEGKLTEELRPKSLSNWSLYPNQAIPMPVYANLNQLQRKMSWADSQQFQPTEISMRSHQHQQQQQKRQLLHSNSLLTTTGDTERPNTFINGNQLAGTSFAHGNSQQFKSENLQNYKSNPTLTTMMNCPNQMDPANYAVDNLPFNTIMKGAISTPKMNTQSCCTTNNDGNNNSSARINRTRSSNIAQNSQHSTFLGNVQRSGFISRDPFSLEMDQLEFTRNASVCHSSTGNVATESPDNLSINSFGKTLPGHHTESQCETAGIKEEEEDPLDTTKIPSLDEEKMNMMNAENLSVMNIDQDALTKDDLFQLPPPPTSLVNF